MNQFLAATTVGGDGMVHQLLVALTVGVCVAIVYLVGRYLMNEFDLPKIATKIWNALFILIGAIFAVNLLLSLTGHGFISW